ncbi:DUF4126 domain-containing protein [Microbacterium keratanolyticum]|uniref:DUF4126 domain-containing protein n=1 Tax=Microbacterium keratanolyticum TaxID=67574 RepID=UPI00363B714A
MIEFIVGSSLATAAGLNAWMPLFLLGLADRLLPSVTLPSGWSWLSNDVSLWIIGLLLVGEVVADKVPALDSVNDVVQSLVRPAAGGIAFGAGSAAQTSATDPSTLFVDNAWVPIAVGIAIALAVHIAKSVIRLGANAVAAGVSAPVLSTAEDGASFALSTSALLAPILAGALLVALLWAAVMIVRRRQRKSTQRPIPDHD